MWGPLHTSAGMACTHKRRYGHIIYNVCVLATCSLRRPAFGVAPFAAIIGLVRHHHSFHNTDAANQCRATAIRRPANIRRCFGRHIRTAVAIRRLRDLRSWCEYVVLCGSSCGRPAVSLAPPPTSLRNKTQLATMASPSRFQPSIGRPPFFMQRTHCRRVARAHEGWRATSIAPPRRRQHRLESNTLSATAIARNRQPSCGRPTYIVAAYLPNGDAGYGHVVANMWR